MLSAVDVTVTRDGQVVLDGVTVSVGPGARLGVVGPNGIGKSTLLGVLSGGIEPDSGRVERAPASLTVGLLSQQLDALPGETLLAYLERRTGVGAASDELDRRTEQLAGDDADLDAYQEALDRFLALGGDDFAARAEVACRDAGLPSDRLDLAVSELSGGQGARARLAAVLLARFEVLLLDEPTNDLDFAGIDLLERYLGAFPGAVVAVSHDRAFLDRAVDRVLEIEEHTHRATEYAGAWSEYVERRSLARRHASAAYEEWRAERRRLSDRIRSQRSWSEQGVRRAARRPGAKGGTPAGRSDNDKAQRGFRVNRTEKQASKVRISERALERLGTIDKPWEGWELHLDLAPTGRSGDRVASLERAVVERGGWTLGPVDLEIGWADRVAITGPNGGGKSTLLAALVGTTPLSAGRRWVGPSVRFGRLDQRRDVLAGPSLVDAFTALTGVLPEEARSTLAKFGLGAEEVRRAPAALSPGERTRAELAALMVTGTNCLVLDEPTNHLDLPAIEQLEAALEDFEGTLLVVSHDRWLLETLSFDRTLVVEGGKVSEPDVVGSARP